MRSKGIQRPNRPRRTKSSCASIDPGGLASLQTSIPQKMNDTWTPVAASNSHGGSRERVPMVVQVCILMSQIQRNGAAAAVLKRPYPETCETQSQRSHCSSSISKVRAHVTQPLVDKGIILIVGIIILHQNLNLGFQKLRQGGYRVPGRIFNASEVGDAVCVPTDTRVLAPPLKTPDLLSDGQNKGVIRGRRSRGR